jgi:O-succinylbenzoate synthase
VTAIAALDRAAGGLEFVEQPCRTLDEVATVRRRVDVPIAVDQSLRDAADPRGLALAEFADLAVLTVGALGGVRRSMRVAETCGIPCLVAAEAESSIGLSGGLALAGVLADVGFASTLGGARLLSGDVVSTGRSLLTRDGYLPVAPMPPAPDPVLVQRFSATPERVDWWRERLNAAQEYL